LTEIAKKSLEAFRLGGATLIAGKGVRHLNGFRQFGDRLIIRAATRALQDKATSPRELNSAMNFAYAFLGPAQVRTEIRALLEAVQQASPRAVLEIGTAQGGTLFLLAQAASCEATIISIDLPAGAFGGGYTSARIPLYKSFALPGQHLELLRANSHDLATLDLVKYVLAETPLDFLFIDADHSAEGVRMDYAMYSPLVREGGLIAIHDIVPGPSELVGAVPEFWRSLKNAHDVVEFVHDWGQRGFGIGLATKRAASRA
jgi:predicted O-methyltransferase YrrM